MKNTTNKQSGNDKAAQPKKATSKNLGAQTNSDSNDADRKNKQKGRSTEKENESAG